DYDFEGEFLPVKITDDKNSKLNSISNFNIVNNLMEEGIYDFYTIDHTQALNKLEEINKSIKSDDNSELLSGGIL
ncbi:MAG: hypothetical protein WAM46_13125, partial [Flavobacterium sp.]